MQRKLRTMMVSATALLALFVLSPADAAGGDCDTGGDAGNVFASATAIQVPVACAGTVNGAVDERDWYKFQATEGDLITARVVPLVAALRVCIYSPAGDEILQDPLVNLHHECSGGIDPGVPAEVLFTAHTSGNWRVKVSGGDEEFGSYKLYINQPEPGTDCATGTEAGNFHETATSIGRLVDCSGSLSGNVDGYDWYAVSLVNGETVTARITAPLGIDFGVCTYSPAGDELQEDLLQQLHTECDSTNGEGPAEVSLTVDSTGEWRIRVYDQGDEEPGSYDLHVQVDVD